MLKYKYGFIFLLSVLLFQSCYKDEIIQDDVNVISIEHPDDPGSGTVVAIIQDEYGNPLEQVIGTIPGQSFISGKHGASYFELENKDQNGTMFSYEFKDRKLVTKIPFLKMRSIIFTQRFLQTLRLSTFTPMMP
jgi:hypothetical protein